MDPARLNFLANHPEIRPHVGGEGALDLTALALNPAVIVLDSEHGAFVLVPILPQVYELHTMFLPEGRGRDFFDRAREMFRYVFCETDAVEIVTKVPDDNRGAAVACAKTGFRERFHRENVSYRSLSIEGWALGDPLCRERGQAFHDTLEAAKIASGSELPVHSEDPAHDAVVGAAMMMRDLSKGVDFYNIWATFAGYATIAIVGPNLVDIRDAIIEVRDGDVGVLQCRSAQSLGLRV